MEPGSDSDNSVNRQGEGGSRIWNRKREREFSVTTHIIITSILTTENPFAFHEQIYFRTFVRGFARKFSQRDAIRSIGRANGIMVAL
jgi:hypothetical protein